MRVMELVELGAAFTRKENGALHLTREGGHSHRRIVHAADVTGREIERALLAATEANGNISFFEHHAAVDLLLDEVQTPRNCSLFLHGIPTIIVASLTCIICERDDWDMKGMRKGL